MKLPVLRHFNPDDIIGEFDTDTMIVKFLKPENFINSALALGYAITETEEPMMHELTKEVKIKAISLVATSPEGLKPTVGDVIDEEE